MQCRPTWLFVQTVPASDVNCASSWYRVSAWCRLTESIVADHADCQCRLFSLLVAAPEHWSSPLSHNVIPPSETRQTSARMGCFKVPKQLHINNKTHLHTGPAQGYPQGHRKVLPALLWYDCSQTGQTLALLISAQPSAQVCSAPLGASCLELLSALLSAQCSVLRPSSGSNLCLFC